jgi:hypothetical protein
MPNERVLFHDTTFFVAGNLYDNPLAASPVQPEHSEDKKADGTEHEGKNHGKKRGGKGLRLRSAVSRFSKQR